MSNDPTDEQIEQLLEESSLAEQILLLKLIREAITQNIPNN